MPACRVGRANSCYRMGFYLRRYFSTDQLNQLNYITVKQQVKTRQDDIIYVMQCQLKFHAGRRAAAAQRQQQW